MRNFIEPSCEVVRFTNNEVIWGCSSDCNCDFGFGPQGDDEVCTNFGVGGDLECVQTPTQGFC